MGVYRVLPLLFLGVLTLGVCQASPDVSPLLAWVTHRAPNSPQQAKVLYHQENAQAAIMDVLTKGWSGASPLVQGQHQASTIVLFLGSQLDTAALSRTSEQLGHIVERAQSSVVLPYALSLKEDILEDLRAAEIPLQAFGCEGQQSQEAVVSELQHELQGQQSTGDKHRVLVVCAAAPAVSPSGNALESELRFLASVQGQLEQQGSPSLVIYATQQPPALQSSSRRSVLSEGKGFGPYKECGQLCQTQVKWLQGILAFLFMAVAAGAGMTCLSMLDTPSRFEKPKEGGPAS